jgi:hypothetical protein
MLLSIRADIEIAPNRRNAAALLDFRVEPKHPDNSSWPLAPDARPVRIVANVGKGFAENSETSPLQGPVDQ